MKVIKVETIKVRLGNREIDLTPDEAQKLRDELDKVLPTKEAIRWYPWQWYPSTTTPTITQPYQPVWIGGGTANPQPYVPTCGTGYVAPQVGSGVSYTSAGSCTIHIDGTVLN